MGCPTNAGGVGQAKNFQRCRKILKEHDSRFEFFVDRAKGSERMIYHPDVNGRPASHPVKYHGEVPN